MQSLRIAYRNVLRQIKRTALLGGAIAFGFFIFTLLNGFTAGLLTSVSENFADLSGGHIYVSGSEVSGLGSEISIIRDTATVENALTSIEGQILSFNTRSSARASVIFGSTEESVLLEGVNFAEETELLDGLSFADGSAETFLTSPNGILLPENTLEDLGIEVGETVIIRTSTVKGQQNVGDAVVVGSLTEQNLFAPGAPTFGYAHIEMLNTLLDMTSDQYQTLNIYLTDLENIDSATSTLLTEIARNGEVEPREETSFGPPSPEDLGFGGLSTVDESERWEGTKFELTNLNDNLQGIEALVGIMNSIALIIFIVIIVIIMVGVMNSYRMVMIERTAEIGTMRAMGVHKSGIRNIFIFEALYVAVAGTIVGLVIAFVAMGGIGLINFGTDSTFGLFLDQGRLAFNWSFLSTLGNILLICVMSAAAVYIPARTAAQMEPAEALRAG